jgi:predicted DNA-binding transcriptional regulator YafY
MPLDILNRKSRVERLREITKGIKDGETYSAFDLAVKYDISINVVYRDIKTLKDEGYIPEAWEFTRKERGG